MKRARVLVWLSVIGFVVIATGAGFGLTALQQLGAAGGTVSVGEPSVAAPAQSTSELAPDDAQPAEKFTTASGTRDAVAGGHAAPAPAPQATAATAAQQQLVVKTATIGLEVDDIQKTTARVQALAASLSGQVENLVYTSGDGESEPVQPMAAEQSSGASAQPSSAQITLRVPAEKLDAAIAAVRPLGRLQSLTSSASDVTAQHVDMAARLKNMRAEEARLRQLFARAGSVSDLLDVEQQLSSVRGDIESAQGELNLLDRQIALSTLTISLAEPGSVVRPENGTSWGVRAAVTAGVQAAVAIVRAFITGAIALLPIVAAILLAWAVVALVRRIRRRGRREGPPATPEMANAAE
jgi:hypothetical protein